MTATTTIKESYTKYKAHCGLHGAKVLHTATTSTYVTHNRHTGLIISVSIDTNSRMLTFDAMTTQGVSIASKAYKLTRHQTYYFGGLLDGTIEFKE